MRAVEGSYEISEDDFNETMQNIEIRFTLSLTEEDLHIFHKNGIVILKANFHHIKMKRLHLRLSLIKKVNNAFTMEKRNIINISERFSQRFILLEQIVI